MSSHDEDRFPWYGTCDHVKQHIYVVRDEYDQAVIVCLSLSGWIGKGTGYCPAYLPTFLGLDPLPTVEEAPR